MIKNCYNFFNPLTAIVGYIRHDADRTGKIIKNVRVFKREENLLQNGILQGSSQKLLLTIK